MYCGHLVRLIAPGETSYKARPQSSPESGDPSTNSMRLLVNKVCVLSSLMMVSNHFAQVSDHPGLLDTSELLRPEAILKEKVAIA